MQYIEMHVNLKWIRNTFVAVTVALTVGLGGQLWHSYGIIERALTIDFRIAELRGMIVYLDEVLTMSARMAVATGDLEWEERYRQFVVQLDAAIGELKELAPLAFNEFTIQTEDANNILVEMENRGFDLLKQGLQEEAAAILVSESYESQKARYAKGMEKLSDSLHVQRDSSLTEQRRIALMGLGQVFVAILVLVSLWIGYARALRRQHAQDEDIARGKRIQQELFKVSITDGLTGLYNRRHEMIRLGEEIERAKRYHEPLSVLMIDLDHFKRINDEYGHLCGDEVLKSFSRLLVDACRTTDIVARYGGEEFVAILPNTEVRQANSLANRICDHTRTKAFIYEDTQLAATCSIGIAVYHSGPCDAEKLMGKADTALYESKNSGRDRVTVA